MQRVKRGKHIRPSTLCGPKNSFTNTFTNIEDPDEMPHIAEFHLGLHHL